MATTVKLSYQANSSDADWAISRLANVGLEFDLSSNRTGTEYTAKVKNDAVALTTDQVSEGDLLGVKLEGKGRTIDDALVSLSYKFLSVATNQPVVTFESVQNGMTKATLWKNSDTGLKSLDTALYDGQQVVTPFAPITP
jgi:hypothetical protein